VNNVGSASKVAGCSIRRLARSDAEALAKLRAENRSFFEPWEPERPPDLDTLTGQLRDITIRERDWAADRRYSFAIVAEDGSIVGAVILSNVSRGAFQNATIGYYVASAYNGRGYATAAVKQAVGYAFTSVGLHRVEAGVMDHNPASKRVLEKAGFRYEGFARNYLRIDGAWRDHHIFAITKEDWATVGEEG
jgi:[ribosomal protein S5]-alanine N-acetyltransferase